MHRKNVKQIFLTYTPTLDGIKENKTITLGYHFIMVYILKIYIHLFMQQILFTCETMKYGKCIRLKLLLISTEKTSRSSLKLKTNTKHSTYIHHMLHFLYMHIETNTDFTYTDTT